MRINLSLSTGLLSRLAVAGALLLVVSTPAAAQNLTERKQSTERELSEIRDEMRLSEERRDALSQEISRLEKDRASVNKSLIDSSARQRDIERRIERASDRLDELRGEETSVRESLNGRRALLGEVLAALQRMGKNPPPALLVSPEDALSSVRSAILLGSVVPEIMSESEILVTELTELVRIRKDIESQRQILKTDLANLAEEEARLTLLLAEKKTLTNSARQELANQSAIAAELAAKANNLGKLIETMEREIGAVREAAEAARLAEAERRKREAEQIANAQKPAAKPDFSDTARISPAMEFAEAQGMLPVPVTGVEISSFGKENRLGEKANGASIATRINARVSSPADGWVVYAGPFRSYGQLLILNAGSGYHIVLAGMERIDVQLGQFVLAGEPVALMGARRVASAEAVGMESSRPVLYVEFRKDGKSIDPSPWWADPTLKRVSDDS